MEPFANAATQSAVRRKTGFSLIGVLFNERFVGRSAVSLHSPRPQRPGRKYLEVAVVALRQPRPRSSGRDESRMMCETKRPVAPLNAALLVAARRVPPLRLFTRDVPT